jgi:thiopeptide-type bacteriocin biosynthesis protein
LIQEGLVKQWFFVRYSDPSHHLRIRLLSRATGVLATFVDSLQQELMEQFESGEVWRLQTDTYFRETDRYGGPLGMLLSEELFCCDSECVVALLRRGAKSMQANRRWLVVLEVLDSLLTDSDFCLERKLALAKKLRDGYFAEFGADRPLRHAVGRKFFDNRASVMKAIEGRSSDGFRPLQQRSERIRPIIGKIQEGISEGQITRSLGELLESYLHMSANRLFRTSARIHEMVIYDVLYRAYNTAIHHLEPRV